MKFVNRKTGAEVRWSFIDQETGERTSAADLEIQEGPGADELVRWRLSHGNRRRKAVLSACAGAARFAGRIAAWHIPCSPP